MSTDKQFRRYVLTDDEDDEKNDKENLAESSDEEWQEENKSRDESIRSKKRFELTYLDLTHHEVVEDECHQAPNASGKINQFVFIIYFDALS